MAGLDQVVDKNIQKLSIKKSINVKNSQKMPEKEVFLQDTQDHIDAVSKVMSFLAQAIKQRGSRHDHTKIDYFEEFYDCFKTTKEDVVKHSQILGASSILEALNEFINTGSFTKVNKVYNDFSNIFKNLFNKDGEK